MYQIPHKIKHTCYFGSPSIVTFDESKSDMKMKRLRLFLLITSLVASIVTANVMAAALISYRKSFRTTTTDKPPVPITTAAIDDAAESSHVSKISKPDEETLKTANDDCRVYTKIAVTDKNTKSGHYHYHYHTKYY
ncbi:hypothetical protein HELRODRAFT_177291 [Helobdella robusta]|uniref:Uncharacterized protein n=1 Tax=Helobdella robusta TaxID=6412 RepID=T1FBG7_HELRO|nr:hypothetical protein HELRODRAFT_177291 [Helobdella robusta]ESN98060.1 hypothetical protein HELRODRAFT_177291 [Helobdella robusta]